MKNSAKSLCFFILSAALLITSCVTRGSVPVQNFSAIEDAALEFRWQTLREGIELCQLRLPEYPLIMHAVKIDLAHPALSVVVTEAALFRDERGTVKAETTLSFAKRNKTIVAANASFFFYTSMLFDINRTVRGIHIADKKIFSPACENFAALVFLDDNSALITDTQHAESFPKNTRHAVSGYLIVADKGCVIPRSVYAEDSRTVVGIADGGKTLFILLVEGEDKRKSRGLSFDQSAHIILRMGAERALQMDGGGSSSLVIYANDEYKIIAPSISCLGLRRIANNFGFVHSD